MGFGALFYDYSPAAGRAAWQGAGLGVYSEYPSDYPRLLPRSYPRILGSDEELGTPQ